MSNRKRMSSLRNRIWSVFQAARIDCEQPNNAPAIRKVLLNGFRRELNAVQGAEEHLLAVGVETELRAMLKGVNDPGHDTPSQMLLWPEAIRKEVINIDRAHVFVPSRNEYIELQPTSISRSEVREAGKYLVSKGKESIGVGRKLIGLAKRWVDPGATEYVAYCAQWISEMDDPTELMRRFDAEEAMRDKLSVLVAERRALRELLKKRIDELGGSG